MKSSFLALAVFISLLIIWINIQLYSRDLNAEETRADIQLQLNFLESELKYNHIGDRMQQIYPEGNLFANVLYGLSWCELILADSTIDINLKNKAISEALFAYNTIDSETVKSTFHKDLKPAYGIFYQGWKNYLLSKILRIDTSFSGIKKYLEAFKAQCDSINDCMKTSQSPYLQSYYQQSWPADMFVAVASLRNHDKVFKPKYDKDIKIWLEKVKQRLDPKTLMIPHQVDYQTGISLYGSRGSSMSLILRMLIEMDNGFAREQYNLFKRNFMSTTFGLPSIREYPYGQKGTGDIDSGPVILGVGFSATIMSIGSLSSFDADFANNLYKTVNAFGFSYKNGDQKKYLLGQLPVADAFIAWGRATNCSDSMKFISNHKNWRTKFHLLSIAIIFIIWLSLFIKKIIKFSKQFIKRQNSLVNQN